MNDQELRAYRRQEIASVIRCALIAFGCLGIELVIIFIANHWH